MRLPAGVHPRRGRSPGNSYQSFGVERRWEATEGFFQVPQGDIFFSPPRNGLTSASSAASGCHQTETADYTLWKVLTAGRELPLTDTADSFTPPTSGTLVPEPANRILLTACGTFLLWL